MTPPFAPPVELEELRDEYEFIGELGRGGTAVVYRARDRALGREVAIKVVHPRAASPDDDPVARLAREARTVAQLQHPNIVAIYAVRRLRGGGIALVLQFVPGATLKTALQRGGAFDAERAERVLRDVAHALAYAHARGVVHRDVKPENVFLDEETGRALLADFGIARSLDADSHTMTGTAIGTPFYMSPEQVDGAPVDARSDVYSLGLVAWEMLTGCRPWDGESLYNVIYKQKREELPPIEALRPDVPHRLQYIIERMLQKRPAARWAGADGLLAQLDHPVLPADYTRWRAALPSRIARHRTRTADAGVVQDETARRQKARDGAPAGAATVQFPRGRRTLQRPPHADAAAVPADPAAPSPPVADRRDAVDGDSARERVDVTTDREVGPALAASQPSGSVAAVVGATDDATPDWGDIPTAATPRATRRLVLGGVVAAISTLGAIGATPGGRKLVSHAGRWLPRPVVSDAMREKLTRSRPTAPARRVPDVSAAAMSAATASAAIRTGAADASTPSSDVLAAGGRHTCLVTVGARIYCWGSDDRAQLGSGALAAAVPQPRAVVGVMSYAAVSAGDSHTCALTRLGDVYCWGENADGQLGDGTGMIRLAPVRVAGLATYRSVSSGGSHSCGVTADGEIRCWGDNARGQLGDGTHESRSIPAAVRLPARARATTLALGDAHACAVLHDARVACWGANDSGELGDGTTTDRTEPVIVPDLLATAVTVGARHSCALTRGGVVRCWGANDAGQLGTAAHDAVPDSRSAVISLPSGDAVTQLTSGDAHTCALTRSGTAWCWGANSRGQLGDGGYGPRAGAVRVRGGPFTAIAAGREHTCGLVNGARPTCWGANDHGQLGTGGRFGTVSPVLVRLPAGVRVASTSAP